MAHRQKTIRKPVSVEGLGLFTGQPCKLTFQPAEPDTGIVFVRTDHTPPVTIPVDVRHVVAATHRTGITNDGVTVETIEHVMSAVGGMGINNLRIEVTAGETPSTDGSALPFVKALQEAGIVEQERPPAVFVIDEPIAVSEGTAMLAALPGPTDRLDILYDLDYAEVPSIGTQVLGFRLGQDNYQVEIAPARTFALAEEAKAMQAQGMFSHLTPKDILVMGPDGPVDNDLRFDDEHVRHKITDLIGDLSLLGRPLRGRIVAYRSGHELNHRLVEKLGECIAKKNAAKPAPGQPVMDIKSIMRLLPHRYPFLMVDRILEMSDTEITGIKNVSINEPFFQGHYPGQPIMPGVLILEAMAQISGILLSRHLEHAGKVAVLLSLDRVKMRRPAMPGDQLVLKAQALHVRPRTGHCKCQALIAGDVACEAEVKFMLVDADATG
jgi:UDP-3-O-[3-hydroxymyristoyl] N-acetylglucosamine deacetylase / 3-hydroxyacyl-[acyl-carrier-protein] dehydratase